MKARLKAMYPHRFFLEADPAALNTWLAEVGWLTPNETVVDAESAGAGNMNCTLRVCTNHRSLIVKQARPWVEKYPQYEAPDDRVLVEAEFYALAGASPHLAAKMPQLLACVEDDRILALEDLGPSRDYIDLYGEAQLEDDAMMALHDWLEGLHSLEFRQVPPRMTNRSMRALNHAHIFEIPFLAEPAMDLDTVMPGLAKVRAELVADTELVAAATILGRLYLADGDHLLHGDYYPGSWLRTAHGPRIIDPEFAFFGDPGFDWGVMAAHLLMSGHDDEAIELTLARSPSSLARRFAGVEVLRRLFGVAQLPLSADLNTRATWAATAASWLKAGR